VIIFAGYISLAQGLTRKAQFSKRTYRFAT
jgi:hypothetical protein